MKQMYLLTLCLAIFSFAANAQTWDWTKPEPNGIVEDNIANPYPHFESDNAHDVEFDNAGNVYVLADFNDSLYLNNNFITSGYGSYLAKYDSIGNLLWYKLIVPTYTPDYYYSQSIKATDLTVNTQGVFITGKYFPSQYSTYDCNTNTGTINATRSYSIGSLNFTSGFTDIGFFLTKFNTNGNVVWNKTGTDSNICINNGFSPPGGIIYNPVITSDKNNNIVAGFVYTPGNEKTSFSINSDVIPLSISAAGNTFHLITVKYNSAGTLQWSNYAGGGFAAGLYDGNGYVIDCNSLVTDNNGNIFFYGKAKDSTYFGSQLFRTQSNNQNIPGNYGFATFIAKLSSAGTWQFVKELCNSSVDNLNNGQGTNGNPERLATDNANNLYIIVNGSYSLTTPFIIMGDSIFSGTGASNKVLVKLDNNGNLIRYQRVATVASDLYSLTYANNSLYVSGYLNQSADNPAIFSSLTVQRNYTTGEYFVAKADTAGVFKWVANFSSDRSAFGNSVKVYKGYIYTCGNYSGGLTSLGHLNGSFNNSDPYITSIFFGKLKDQYIHVGTITPTQLIPGCTITVPFTSTGLTFSAGNTFTAELSNASGDFTTPTVIGTTVSTGTGSITATIPASITYGSGFVVRIRSSDTLKTGYNYYAYADTGYKLSLVCPAPSTGFTATNITGTTATVNWASVGCASGYKVQYRIKGTTAWITVNIATNTPTLNITGLALNTIYQWKVATKCKNNSVTSYSAYSAIKQFTTLSAFAAAENISDAEAYSTTEITIAPNPAKNQLHISINGLKTIVQSLQVINAGGSKVAEKTFSINNHSSLTIDVSNYTPGLYMLLLKTNEGVITKKFIKE